MIRTIVLASIVLGALLGFSLAPTPYNVSSVALASGLHYFSTPQAAQHHCPHDTVVWLNIPSGIYHYAGERWFGRTENGAYVCEREAIAAGDRASRNGQ